MRVKQAISFLVWVSIVLLAVSIMALSWKASPALVHLPFIPKGILSWADKEENENIRTAVPFLLLGVLMGFILGQKKSVIKRYLMSCFLCLLFLSVVEGVQFFLPRRHADMGDIGWGEFGFVIGVTIAELLHQAFREIIKDISDFQIQTDRGKVAKESEY